MTLRDRNDNPMDYKILLSIIPVGKDNSVTQIQIAKNLNCSTRNAKFLIKVAREHSIIILSGAKGYWQPTSDSEVIEFCNELRQQGRSRLILASKLESIVKHKQIKGQLSINDIYTTGE